MRFILVIGLFAGLFTTTAAHAHEINNQCTKNSSKNIYFSIENNGFICGIGHGKIKKALYKKPVYDTFKINASAYTAAADECGKSDGITASGNIVKENHTLACPREYAFGTKVHIEGMGTYICEDRGGAIKGNKFDIYMKTKKEAFAFGRRNLIAYVIS
ncbi:MAG: hypothetical protein CR972_01575 [Candidatus Moraniibacteriota bacterium]|nr:MAG: hypothetical protein CR972_01575 [Candidatus Moranbacteria bacterium]